MKKIKHLFIATSSFGQNSKLFKSLKKYKISYSLNPLKKKLDTYQLIKFAKNSTHIIAGTEVYNELVFKKLNNLKFIYRLGSGKDNINLKDAKLNNINVKFSKVSLEKAVGELTIALILNLLRKITSQNQNMKLGVWKKEMGNLFFGKTLGIIGYGNIGKYVAKLSKNFGVKLLIFDVLKDRSKTSISNLLSNSDIITIHSNYTKDNFNFLNKEKLKLIKKNSILINTSRPEIIDYDYLYYLVKNKEIGGAALDVFEKEPYNGRLKKLSNIILTPHIGSYAKEVRIQMEEDAIRSIIND